MSSPHNIVSNSLAIETPLHPMVATPSHLGQRTSKMIFQKPTTILSTFCPIAPINSSLPRTYQTAAPLRMFPQNRYYRQVISQNSRSHQRYILPQNTLTNITTGDRPKHASHNKSKQPSNLPTSNSALSQNLYDCA